jgi:hypothetical protein
MSAATKAHPLALFQSLAKAAQKTQRKLRLVLYGYFLPEDQAALFQRLAAAFRDQVAADIITNDDPRFPDGLWAAGDIFASLIDNVQESFGLTPIEAMAAGLPTVVSDWDGYKDSTIEGETGFLVPTLAPSAEAGAAIADFYMNHDNYGAYLMGAAQSTAIDTDQAAACFARLADDDNKRRAMGAAARARARAIYDWRVIIPAYEALWQEQGERKRLLAPPKLPIPHLTHPYYVNPFAAFAAFPSKKLSPQSFLRVVMTSEEISRILDPMLGPPVPDLLVSPDNLRSMIEGLSKAGRVQVSAIASAMPEREGPRLMRCLGWMLKCGICICEDE